MKALLQFLQWMLVGLTGLILLALILKSGNVLSGLMLLGAIAIVIPNLERKVFNGKLELLRSSIIRLGTWYVLLLTAVFLARGI